MTGDTRTTALPSNLMWAWGKGKYHIVARPEEYSADKTVEEKNKSYRRGLQGLTLGCRSKFQIDSPEDGESQETETVCSFCLVALRNGE